MMIPYPSETQMKRHHITGPFDVLNRGYADLQDLLDAEPVDIERMLVTCGG